MKRRPCNKFNHSKPNNGNALHLPSAKTVGLLAQKMRSKGSFKIHTENQVSYQLLGALHP
jgi:hypothetical protein